MNKIKQDLTGGYPLTMGTIGFFQDAVRDVFRALSLAFQNDPESGYKLIGAVRTGNTISEGWIVFKGEPCYVPPHNVTPGASSYVWVRKLSNHPTLDPKRFYNGTNQSFHQVRTVELEPFVAQVDTLPEALLTYWEVAVAQHNHDARYYTQAQTNTQISNAIDALLNGAPGALDTLNELAAALGSDPNFATTVINGLASKAPLVHTHAIADIVGLQAALDARPAGVVRFFKGEVKILSKTATDAFNGTHGFAANGLGFGKYVGWAMADGRNSTIDRRGMLSRNYDASSVGTPTTNPVVGVRNYAAVGNKAGTPSVVLEGSQTPLREHVHGPEADNFMLTTNDPGINKPQYRWSGGNFESGNQPNGKGVSNKTGGVDALATFTVAAHENRDESIVDYWIEAINDIL